MKQATLIIGLSVVGFAVAFGALIASRLSQEQVALLVGVTCGVGLGGAAGVAIGWAAATRRRAPEAPSPHIIYMTAPTVPSTQPATRWLPQGEPTATITPRTFNVIGNSGFEEEP